MNDLRGLPFRGDQNGSSTTRLAWLQLLSSSSLMGTLESQEGEEKVMLIASP